MRSPIEIMIDRAVGYEPGTSPRVWLRCPLCGSKKRVNRDPSDYPGTATVQIACPKCCDEPTIVDYFDASGRQIDDRGVPMK